MSGRDSFVESKRIELLTAIGNCMQAWARVETTLICLFRNVSGIQPEFADAHLIKARQFSGRLKMIDGAAQSKLVRSDHLDDWKLLREHTRTLGELRNQVQHATIFNHRNEYALQPYFLARDVKPYLLIDDVNNAAGQFCDLAEALEWFRSTVIAPTVPFHSGPTPQLLLRLRSK